MSKSKTAYSSIAAALFSVAGAFSAHAADVVVPTNEVEQPISTPVYSQPAEQAGTSFAGFYIGAKVGYDISDTIEAFLKKGEGRSSVQTMTQTGLVASGFLGFNVEAANGFLIGVDADVNYTDRQSSFGFYLYKKNINGAMEILDNTKLEALPSLDGVEFSTTMKNTADKSYYRFVTISDDLSGSLSARFGYAVTDNFMPYLLAGGVLKKITVSSDTFFSSDKKTGYIYGYNLGAGVDIRLAENVFVRGEYRCLNFYEKTFTLSDKAYVPNVHLGEVTNRASVGIALKF